MKVNEKLAKLTHNHSTQQEGICNADLKRYAYSCEEACDRCQHIANGGICLKTIEISQKFLSPSG